MSEPLVSVILPVYNAGKYLRLAVLSIVQQNYGNWELLLIDDGSTDGAVESLADIEDSRIQIINNSQNIGLAATLNRGISLAKGQYLARMDQDDIAFPDRFARQVEMLEADVELDLVGGRCLAIDEQNEPVGLLPFDLNHSELCRAPWRGFYLAHPTWMGRIEWFRTHQYCIPEPHLCEDQELLLRTYPSSKFATCPEVLFAYRIRTSINLKRLFRNRLSFIRMQFGHFVASRQWRHAFLALLVFFGRTTRDAVLFLQQRSGSNFIKRQFLRPDDEVIQKYKNIISGILSILPRPKISGEFHQGCCER